MNGLTKKQLRFVSVDETGHEEIVVLSVLSINLGTFLTAHQATDPISIPSGEVLLSAEAAKSSGQFLRRVASLM